MLVSLQLHLVGYAALRCAEQREKISGGKLACGVVEASWPVVDIRLWCSEDEKGSAGVVVAIWAGKTSLHLWQGS